MANRYRDEPLPRSLPPDRYREDGRALPPGYPRSGGGVVGGRTSRGPPGHTPGPPPGGGSPGGYSPGGYSPDPYRPGFSGGAGNFNDQNNYYGSGGAGGAGGGGGGYLPVGGVAGVGVGGGPPAGTPGARVGYPQKPGAGQQNPQDQTQIGPRSHKSASDFPRRSEIDFDEGMFCQLHRILKMEDRFQTTILTFIVPGAFEKEDHLELPSADFLYGYQRWAIQLVKNEKHVSAFLQLRSATEGIVVTVDFSFSVLSKEHFTKNESFKEEGCEFNHVRHTYGRRTFVCISDIFGGKFAFQNGDLLLELMLRKAKTVFEYTMIFPLSPDNVGRKAYQAEMAKYESTYFNFGDQEWNISIYPMGDGTNESRRPLIQLNRLSGFDHVCKVKYRNWLGEDSKKHDSRTQERYFDCSGLPEGYEIRGRTIYDIIIPIEKEKGKSKLKIRCELLGCVTVSDLYICPLNKKGNTAHLYDRESQAWLLESSLEGKKDCLTFKLYYTDMFNVPRGYIRTLSWNLFVIPNDERTPAVNVSGETSYSAYYAQSQTDTEGYEMLTKIPVHELTNGPYLDDGGKLRLQIEWVDSQLVVKDNYHYYDDISKKQRHQMKREIQVLQKENYDLERQLHGPPPEALE